MRHLSLYEKFGKEEDDKILYLHGLDSSPWKDRVDILKSTGAFVVAPQFNYREQIVWKQLEELHKENHFDAVVGHSLGGYLAYYFSNYFKIPALMFMPAFGSRKSDIDELQPLPKEVMNALPYKDQMAVVGMKDDVVHPKVQIRFLERTNAEIFREPNEGHRFAPSLFQKYVDKFYNKQYF